MPRVAGSRRSQPAREGKCVTAGSTAGAPSSHSVGELVSHEDGSGLDVDVRERSTGLFASVDRGDDRGRVRALCPESRSLIGQSSTEDLSHADRLRGGSSETVTLIEAPTRRVGHEADVRASGRIVMDLRQQCAQDGVAQTTPLVVGEHGHVEYVEVPTAVTEAPSHAHRRGRRSMDHMKCRPATVERRQSLVRASGRQAGAHPQVQVVLQGWGTFHQLVFSWAGTRDVHDHSITGPAGLCTGARGGDAVLFVAAPALLGRSTGGRVNDAVAQHDARLGEHR